MRKRIIEGKRQEVHTDGDHINLEAAGEVEMTSEDPEYPVEGALSTSGGNGWRAAYPGPQTLRFLFDRPQKISCIRLVFREENHPRTQEFVLRCLTEQQGIKDVVRQQYTFAPPGTTVEVEEYSISSESVTVLELEIAPDIDSSGAYASLEEFRVYS